MCFERNNPSPPPSFLATSVPGLGQCYSRPNILLPPEGAPSQGVNTMLSASLITRLLAHRVDAVRRLGAEIVLVGDTYAEAQSYAQVIY